MHAEQALDLHLELELPKVRRYLLSYALYQLFSGNFDFHYYFEIKSLSCFKYQI